MKKHLFILSLQQISDAVLLECSGKRICRVRTSSAGDRGAGGLVRRGEMRRDAPSLR